MPIRLIALLFLGSLTAASAAWFKGNTHTHTNLTDGDSAPEDVAKWYQEHGYDFLFITDHEMITDVAPLNAALGNGGKFLVMRGEEVTANFPGKPPLAVHVNALEPREVVHAQKGADARATLQLSLDGIRAAGGISHINHPNFRWQLTAADIAAVKGAQLMEIANMHPIVNTFGAGPEHPSCETIWDQALTLGAKVWGTATDDVHQLKASGSSTAGTAGEGAGAGKGWIVVRADELKTEAIVAAIARGDFYASTGVALKDYTGDAKKISLEVATTKPDVTFATKYLIQFIGREGKVLQETVALAASYEPKGDEGYVRVRITNSNGKQAWTQPVFLDGRGR